MKTEIEMAREAGFEVTYEYRDGDLEWGGSTKAIERFAELVRADAIADEREACARVCDELHVKYEEGKNMAVVCAAYIRARSNT